METHNVCVFVFRKILTDPPQEIETLIKSTTSIIL